MGLFLKDVGQKHVKEARVLPFCEVSGGPCKRSRQGMRQARAGNDVTRTDFNALVEVLPRSMVAQGIAFITQTRMPAKARADAPRDRQCPAVALRCGGVTRRSPFAGVQSVGRYDSFGAKGVSEMLLAPLSIALCRHRN